MSADVIDLLVGIRPGSRLDEIRAMRPQARENAQRSFLALFAPEPPGTMSLAERHAIAVFVAGLHREPEILAFYQGGIADAALATAAVEEAALGAVEGPYGRYPAEALAAENLDGPVFRVQRRAVLGARLSAAFEHAHMLVFRPREASAEDLQHLLDAGWSTTDIVTLSQLVAFLSFQIRVVAGLRALAATGDAA
jgi:CMD domain protein